jgi:predicted dithiol-disulfide oxidoreductase (DUF899 family)
MRSPRGERIPMVRFADGYAFDTPAGTKTLFDLFDGRDQLVVYSSWTTGRDHYCPGCTWLTNNVPVTGLDGAGRARGHLGDRFGHAARPRSRRTGAYP